ncbi:GspH/FimT family pseudopilin [Silanimonas lenta]|uniref:GspH/FimT family pseudopilin n=1 Tax=Silanimonas lenta TaxID=265429 RepID=UPI002FE2DF41
MRVVAGPSRSGGVSLVEVIVTVAILAIIAAVGIPAFNNVILTNRLAAASNELVGSLQLARSEAIRRGARVVVCASSTGSSCSGGWSNGWIVFEDRNRDGAVSAGETVIRSHSGPTGLQVLASGNIGSSIAFRSDGRARQASGALLAGRINVCRAETGVPLNVRQIEIAAGSRVTVSRVSGGGACATPANP